MIKPERKLEIYQFVGNKLIEADIPRAVIDNFDDNHSNIKVSGGFDIPIGIIVKDLLFKYKWFLNKDNPISINSSHFGNNIIEINIHFRD